MFANLISLNLPTPSFKDSNFQNGIRIWTAKDDIDEGIKEGRHKWENKFWRIKVKFG